MARIAYALYRTPQCSLAATTSTRGYVSNRRAFQARAQPDSWKLTRQQFFEEYPGADLNKNPVRRLICGGLAGITSVTFTYPLDIVRTRLSIQSASFSALQRKQGEQLPGMWTTMIMMYKNEGGWLALYRGIIPTVAGVAPYVSIDSTKCPSLLADRHARLVSTS